MSRKIGLAEKTLSLSPPLEEQRTAAHREREVKGAEIRNLGDDQLR
jgi:hypothetical protein